jgi:hypothetical protein
MTALEKDVSVAFCCFIDEEEDRKSPPEVKGYSQWRAQKCGF